MEERGRRLVEQSLTAGIQRGLGFRILSLMLPITLLIVLATLAAAGYVNHRAQIEALSTRGRLLVALQAGGRGAPPGDIVKRPVG
jgi:hypothetical protein